MLIRHSAQRARCFSNVMTSPIYLEVAVRLPSFKSDEENRGMRSEVETLLYEDKNISCSTCCCLGEVGPLCHSKFRNLIPSLQSNDISQYPHHLEMTISTTEWAGIHLWKLTIWCQGSLILLLDPREIRNDTTRARQSPIFAPNSISSHQQRLRACVFTYHSPHLHVSCN
jgi:hypothetical protein